MHILMFVCAIGFLTLRKTPHLIRGVLDFASVGLQAKRSTFPTC